MIKHELNIDDFIEDEIIEIEELGIDSTVDLVVEDAHMFALSNGLYTHNSGFKSEVIELDQVADAFSKCYRANFILTLSRRKEDVAANTGRIFIGKSNIGRNGVVFPMFMDTFNTCKIELLPETIYDEPDIPNVADQKEKMQKLLQQKLKGMK